MRRLTGIVAHVTEGMTVCLVLGCLVTGSLLMTGCGSAGAQGEEAAAEEEAGSAKNGDVETGIHETGGTLESSGTASADEAGSAAEDSDVEPAILEPADGKQNLAALQKINPEAYAWLEIVGTNMSYPLLQSASDEYFYLTHNIYGEEDDNGCIYTEYYNDKDFQDVNTVIYGRNKDKMFGRLHQYQDRDFFENHREIRIYQEDRVLVYRIFAAYTYDDRHLIATYDFADKTVFERYLEDIFAIRAMDAYIDDSVEVTTDDRLITLSTGVTGEDDRRYLVQAVLQKDGE